MREKWRRVDTHPDFEISSQGRLRRIGSDRFISSRTTRDGYLQANLGSKKQGRTQRIHRLVASAFLEKPKRSGVPDHLWVVHHINHKRDDNRVENLAWVTPQENAQASSSFRGGPLPSTTNAEILRQLAEMQVQIQSILKHIKNF